MTIDERRRPAVGSEIKRWRTERGLTLATVAERSGLNVGYLSQLENDKASPSLTCLQSIGDALDVPIAWFLMADVPAPHVVRRHERPTRELEWGRIERVDGGVSRDVTVQEVIVRPGGRVETHAHAGDEHHLVLRGRLRMIQGAHTIEVEPGDYVRWDGAIPHDAEGIGPEEAAVLIVSVRTTR